MANNTSLNNRRSFLKAGITVAAGSFITQPLIASANNAIASLSEVKNSTILFQGDSITDGNRTRNDDWNHVMGHGYAYIAASKLWYEFPEQQYHFFNRGISGNTVNDLEIRWQTDTLAIKPDVLSILVGINDTNAFIRGNKNFTVQLFEEKYRALLQRTKNELPQLKLVLAEPFILPVGKVKQNQDVYETELPKRQQVVAALAKEFDAVFIPYQQIFNDALKKAPAEYWIWDGIHPMPAGHYLMALEWIKYVRKTIKI